jgi:hypothetical protein
LLDVATAKGGKAAPHGKSVHRLHRQLARSVFVFSSVMLGGVAHALAQPPAIAPACGRCSTNI